MIGQKDKAFAGFRIDKTDAAQMLWIILPAVEAVKRDGLIEAQACRLVDGARINPVIVHVDFSARDEEGACLMERIEPAKIDVAAIHHINGSGLGHDQIERRGIAYFAVRNMDKAGDRAAQIEQRV